MGEGVEGRREIGLFRYALVRDVADPALSKAERGRLVRALAERGTSRARRAAGAGLARGTLDEWVRAYRRGGFEALVPRPRVVVPRTPAGGAGARVPAVAGAAGANRSAGQGDHAHRWR